MENLTEYYRFISKVQFTLMTEKEQLNYLNRTIKATSKTRKREPPKFLDNLKKKLPKLARRIIKNHLDQRLHDEYSHFSILNRDRQVLENILNSEYWPNSEFKATGQGKYKSFSYKCLGELLLMENETFFELYRECVEHLFVHKPIGAVEKFLALHNLTAEQYDAFHYYFAVVIPNKAIEYHLYFK